MVLRILPLVLAMLGLEVLAPLLTEMPNSRPTRGAASGVFLLAAAVTRPDTAVLARYLRGAQSDKSLSKAKFLQIQAAYLAWIDTRVKARESWKSMASELKAAGALPKQTNASSLDINLSDVGRIEPPAEVQIADVQDLLAVQAPIYTNDWCGLDVTLILYDKPSRRRLGWVNGGLPASGAFYLSSLAVGGKDARGGRIFASGWAISNCTSTWNGKSIRIDRMNGVSNFNLLARPLWAHDREGPPVLASIRGSEVTFLYNGGLPDTELAETASIASYKIEHGRAVRQSPIALTRAGFIAEWLDAGDIHPSDYATAVATERRSATAIALKSGISEWKAVARCSGPPPVWEVAVRIADEPHSIVFRISGERASELRMIGITPRLTPGCEEIDISKGLDPIGSQLPW